jgi:hypothetical protein
MGTPLDALVALDREPRYLIVDGAGRGDALLATLRGE